MVPEEAVAVAVAKASWFTLRQRQPGAEYQHQKRGAQDQARLHSRGLLQGHEYLLLALSRRLRLVSEVLQASYPRDWSAFCGCMRHPRADLATATTKASSQRNGAARLGEMACCPLCLAPKSSVRTLVEARSSSVQDLLCGLLHDCLQFLRPQDSALPSKTQHPPHNLSQA